VPRRKLKKVPKATKIDPTTSLRKALAKRRKDELVVALGELAENSTVRRRLMERFAVETSADELVAATRTAIADATDFDERLLNTNFDYDYEAYAEVRRNLARLIDLGRLPTAMELSLELMHDACYQMEMSDEGLMAYEIEECLEVVLAAVRRSDLSMAEIKTWSSAMLATDRTGCLCASQLQALARGSKAKK
jgi:hypothetical protein